MMPGPLHRDRARIVFDCRMANDTAMMPRTMSETTHLKMACERCGGHIEYPSEMAGRSIQCPHCQHSITLPPTDPQDLTKIGEVPFRFVGVVKGPFGVWIDPQKWERASSEENPIKIDFNHKKGEAYAILIAERISFSMELLKKAAVANAKKAMPDVKIASEEKRVVKGKELLCLKLTGTFQGTPYIYYGYYYGGSGRSLQVVTYTASNLFDEFKQDFDDFLNGTRIGQ
jgi:DNA-directed RNA polymerase subunit RPC12/RpoP